MTSNKTNKVIIRIIILTLLTYFQVYADTSSDITKSRQNAITEAIKNNSSAVVGINVTEVVKVQYQDPFDIFWNDPFFQPYSGGRRQSPNYRQYEVQGLGSGFIISKRASTILNSLLSASRVFSKTE